MIIESELTSLADFRADYSRAKLEFDEVEGGEASLEGCLAYLTGQNMSIFAITLARRYLFDIGFEYPELMAELHIDLELKASELMLSEPDNSLDVRVASLVALLLARCLRTKDGLLAASEQFPFASILDQACSQIAQAKDLRFANAIGTAALLAIVTDQPKVAKEFLSLRKSFKFFPKAEKLLRSLADFSDAQSAKSPNEPLEVDQATRDLFLWIFDDYRTRYRTEKPGLMFSADATQLCNGDPGSILLADFYLRRLSSKPSPVPSFDDVKRLVTWKGI
jgi:hypothetical protein